jgi:hypothetical protein
MPAFDLSRRVLDERERYVQELRANEADVQRKYQQASRDLLSSKKELKKIQTEIEQLEKKQKVFVDAFFLFMCERLGGTRGNEVGVCRWFYPFLGPE